MKKKKQKHVEDEIFSAVEGQNYETCSQGEDNNNFEESRHKKKKKKHKSKEKLEGSTRNVVSFDPNVTNKNMEDINLKKKHKSKDASKETNNVNEVHFEEGGQSCVMAKVKKRKEKRKYDHIDTDNRGNTDQYYPNKVDEMLKQYKVKTKGDTEAGILDDNGNETLTARKKHKNKKKKKEHDLLESDTAECGIDLQEKSPQKEENVKLRRHSKEKKKRKYFGSEERGDIERESFDSGDIEETVDVNNLGKRKKKKKKRKHDIDPESVGDIEEIVVHKEDFVKCKKQDKQKKKRRHIESQESEVEQYTLPEEYHKKKHKKRKKIKVDESDTKSNINVKQMGQVDNIQDEKGLLKTQKRKRHHGLDNGSQISEQRDIISIDLGDEQELPRKRKKKHKNKDKENQVRESEVEQYTLPEEYHKKKHKKRKKIKVDESDTKSNINVKQMGQVDNIQEEKGLLKTDKRKRQHGLDNGNQNSEQRDIISIDLGDDQELPRKRKKKHKNKDKEKQVQDSSMEKKSTNLECMSLEHNPVNGSGNTSDDLADTMRLLRDKYGVEYDEMDPDFLTDLLDFKEQNDATAGEDTRDGEDQMRFLHNENQTSKAMEQQPWSHEGYENRVETGTPQESINQMESENESISEVGDQPGNATKQKSASDSVMKLLQEKYGAEDDDLDPDLLTDLLDIDSPPEESDSEESEDDITALYSSERPNMNYPKSEKWITKQSLSQNTGKVSLAAYGLEPVDDETLKICAKLQPFNSLSCKRKIDDVCIHVENFAKLGLVKRHASWTPEEDKRLQYNWDKFFEENPFDEPRYFLSHRKDTEKELRVGITTIQKETNFWRRLGHGLKRTTRQVYYRARLLLLQGQDLAPKHWHMEEGQTIERMFDEEGKSISEIAEYTKRSFDAVKYYILKYKSLQARTSVRHAGQWTEQEDNRLIDALKKLSGRTYVRGLQHGIPWEKVSKLVGTRLPVQCHHRWNTNLCTTVQPGLYYRLRLEKRIKFIEVLTSMDIKEWQEIDWKKVRKSLEPDSPTVNYLQHMLMYLRGPHRSESNLKNSFEYMRKQIPKLKNKLERGLYYTKSPYCSDTRIISPEEDHAWYSKGKRGRLMEWGEG